MKKRQPSATSSRRAADPRPGRRPRNGPTTSRLVDIGEADGRPISVGFEPEPPDLPPDVAGQGEQSERDYRAPAASSHDAESLAAKNLRGR